MRNRPVYFIERAALEHLPTKALLGRLHRLRECEEAPEASDLTKADIAAAPGILFKQAAEWSAAYSDLKAILATREHLPRGPDDVPTERTSKPTQRESPKSRVPR